MLDLATLKATLQPIRQIGEVEEYFKIDGIEVCMRVLTPKEELQVQRWANSILAAATVDQRENDNSLAVEYLNRFKLGCLAYSLVEINGMDLRNEEFIATGEVLKNGKPVKVKKTDALIDILEGWPRPLLSAVFKKFNEVMERCEIQSDQSVEYNPPDIEAEIQQLLNRLQTLEEMKKRKDDADVITGNLNTDGDAVEEPVTTHKAAPEWEEPTHTPEPVQTQPEPVQTQTAAGTVRRSAIPQQANPIEPAYEPQEQEAVQNEQPTVEHTETFQTAAGTTATAAPNDGWVDPKDDDAMENAMAAETRRMQELRARRFNQAAAPNSNEQVSADTSANPRFKPPSKR